MDDVRKLSINEYSVAIKIIKEHNREMKKSQGKAKKGRRFR